MAETMRAAVYHAPRKLEVEDWPLPEPGAQDVLIEVSHCGICGTDLHLVIEGMGRPQTIGGHEYSGTVVAVGSEVQGFAPGDAVVGSPARPGCGSCEYCREGRPSLCSQREAFGIDDFQGAFAQYVKLDARQVHRVPAGVSLRAAALTEPLAVALHGITLGELAPGQRILITGAGPIGALTLAALRARGFEDVSVSEPAPARRALAERLGAARVLVPDDLTAPRWPFEIAEDAYHVAFECSGHPEAIQSALAQLRRGGRLVIVGTGMKRPKLDFIRVILNELVVTGSYNYDATGFADALALLASGRIPCELLTEPGDVTLENMLGAMERLAAGKTPGKVLVAPN